MLSIKASSHDEICIMWLFSTIMQRDNLAIREFVRSCVQLIASCERTLGAMSKTIQSLVRLIWTMFQVQNSVTCELPCQTQGSYMET